MLTSLVENLNIFPITGNCIIVDHSETSFEHPSLNPKGSRSLRVMQTAVYYSTFFHEFSRELTLGEFKADAAVLQGAPPHIIKGSSTYYGCFMQTRKF